MKSISSTKPLFYRTKTGGKGVGYDARLLPQVARGLSEISGCGACREGRHPLVSSAYPANGWRRRSSHSRCSPTLASLALVDEATGLSRGPKLSRPASCKRFWTRFLRKELAAWAKRIPDEFYEQIFRLRGWQWRGRGTNPPQVVAAYTKDIVYSRLAPGIIDELEKRIRQKAGSVGPSIISG